MSKSPIPALVLLAAGVALLIWGFAAKDSVSSVTSEVFTGAPSDQAMILIVLGVIIGGIGLIGLVRRRA
ncbi:MAG: DUF3185 family protein [Planctomycetota bacterium]